MTVTKRVTGHFWPQRNSRLDMDRSLREGGGLSRSIGIVGGGPAGLSLARMLGEQGFGNITVFEALPQVGGKSYTVFQGRTVVEMGTCYATFSHKVTNRWMRELDMPMSTLGDQRFDGADFVDYIKAGSGPPLAFQLVRYFYEKTRLFNALNKPQPPEWALEDAALPIADWLRKRNLGKVENFMHRSTTNIAYGFVDETPVVQALVWNDMNLLLTGVFNQLKMPDDGWAEFWARIASQLNVQTGARVTSIERGDSDIVLNLENGERFIFDEIVSAIPLDEFNSLTTPTENERYVADSVTWNGYTTTLFAADNWFTDVKVEGYKEAVIPGAHRGQLLSARLDGIEPDLGGHLYLSGQLSGEYTGDELVELLKAGVAERGGTVTNVILQKMWKYFAQYDQKAVRQGLLGRLRDMQGEARTWYTGAIYSHEAVSHIVNFNKKLAKTMARTLTA